MGDAGGPSNGRHPSRARREMKTHHIYNPEAEEFARFEEFERPDYLRAVNAGGFGVTVHDADGGGFLFEVAGPALTVDALRELYHWADDLADPADA